MFDLTSHYNDHLGPNRESMRLILSLGLPEQAQVTRSRVALAIVLDCSGSMAGEKIQAARDGAIKVIQELDEQFSFVVIAFTHEARLIYGPSEGIHAHKQRAIQAIQYLHADGGTSMSNALHAVIKSFDPYREWARTVLFLTDGQNGDKKPAFLQSVEECVRERISIYAWGVGSDWNADELRALAEKTHGNADIIPRPQQIEAAFRQTFNQIRQTALTNVRLALWTPEEVVVQQVEQVYPNMVNLTLQTDGTNPRQQLISLGAFSTGERRDFLVNLNIKPHEPGRPYMIMRPSIKFVDAQRTELEERGPRESWIAVEWTLDVGLAAKINERVAHYTREGELAELITGGTEARARGDLQQAAALLGQALALSEQLQNEEIARLLRMMVTQGANGQISLKNADALTLKTLEIKKGKTAQIN
ncbi:MAG TPA: vWA domain-containing protein [Ktedonobacteraceae bacterium]